MIPAVVAICIFAALSVTAAITSTGFLEADSCTHYLYARYAFAEPYLFVNIWGRPICTGIYSIPAYFAGRIGVRLMSLLVAIAIAVLARSIARGQHWRWPVLALVFTLAQPLVFLHSFSELTELPFALLLAAGFLAYQRKYFAGMALAIGLTPLSRPEGFGLLVLAAVALVLHRKWMWLALLALPLIVWDLTGWWMYGHTGPWWNWLRENWPYEAKSLYQAGSLFHFVMLMPVVTSPLIFPATALGIGQCFSGDGSLANLVRRFFSDHLRRCEILIAALPVMILIGHSLLYWLGKMSSNGEVRYMLVVAPFWGLLAARGWTWVFEQMNWRFAVRWAAVAALAPVVAHFYYPVIPLRQQPDWIEAEQIADWYKSGNRMELYPFIATSHPGILYHLDLSPSDGGHVREWKKDVLLALPGRTIVVWDPIYGVFNSDKSRSVTADDLDRAGWVPLATPWSAGETAGKWRVFRSPGISGDAGRAAMGEEGFFEK